IPEVLILEKRYGDKVPGLPPLKPVPGSNEASEARMSPVPIPIAGTGPRLESYHVAPQGETMREIARKQLGDGERLAEIARLNPTQPFDRILPGGTVLVIPVEAKPPTGTR